MSKMMLMTIMIKNAISVSLDKDSAFVGDKSSKGLKYFKKLALSSRILPRYPNIYEIITIPQPRLALECLVLEADMNKPRLRKKKGMNPVILIIENILTKSKVLSPTIYPKRIPAIEAANTAIKIERKPIKSFEI